MLKELEALEKNGTWELVHPHAYATVIGCKSVFAVKSQFDGSLARLKACRAAKGYIQVYGVAYFYT